MSKTHPDSQWFRLIGFLFLLLSGIVVSGCLQSEKNAGGSSEEITGTYAIYLKGRVLFEDGKPAPRVLARLAKTDISDLTDAEGYYLISLTKEDSARMKPFPPADAIHFFRDNLLFARLEVENWIDSLLPVVYIHTRSITGSLVPNSIAIAKIVAELREIPEPDTPRRTQFWYDKHTHDYSGKFHFLASHQPRNYSVKIFVYDTLNHLTGQSIPKRFNELAGDISIPNFGADNSCPLIINIEDSLIASPGDTIRFRPTVTDSFGGKIVEFAWDIGAAGFFSKTAHADTLVKAPDTDGVIWPSIFRVKDDDGNIVRDTLEVNITKSFSRTGPSIEFSFFRKPDVILDDNSRPYIVHEWETAGNIRYSEILHLRDNKWTVLWNDTIHSTSVYMDGQKNFQIQEDQTGKIHLLVDGRIMNSMDLVGRPYYFTDHSYKKYVLTGGQWAMADSFTSPGCCFVRLHADGTISFTSLYRDKVKKRVAGNWVDIDYRGLVFEPKTEVAYAISPDSRKFIIKTNRLSDAEPSQIYALENNKWTPLWTDKSWKPNSIDIIGFSKSGIYCGTNLSLGNKKNSRYYLYSNKKWKPLTPLDSNPNWPKRIHTIGQFLVSDQDILILAFLEPPVEYTYQSKYYRRVYRYMKNKWTPVPRDNFPSEEFTLAKNEQGKIIAIMTSENAVYTRILE